MAGLGSCVASACRSPMRLADSRQWLARLRIPGTSQKNRSPPTQPWRTQRLGSCATRAGDLPPEGPQTRCSFGDQLRPFRVSFTKARLLAYFDDGDAWGSRQSGLKIKGQKVGLLKRSCLLGLCWWVGDPLSSILRAPLLPRTIAFLLTH